MVATAIVAVALIAVRQWHQRQSVTRLRQDVFCQQIRPGMARQEAMIILSHYGQFTETTSETGPIQVTYMAFDDPAVNQSFGGRPIVLAFENEQFIRATIPALADAYDPVCP
jgi:hypothetical protein